MHPRHTNNNNNNNRQTNTQMPFQIQREVKQGEINKQYRSKYCNSKRQVQQIQTNQIQQVQAQASQPKPNTPTFQVFSNTTQVLQTQHFQSPLQGQRQIMQQQIQQLPSTHPASLEMNTQVQLSQPLQSPVQSQQQIMQQSSTTHPPNLEMNIGVHEGQYDRVQAILQQQENVQQTEQHLDQDQNMMEHQFSQFENASQIRKDEQGLQSTPLQENNHQVNVPPPQQQEVENLNSQSSLQIKSKKVSPVQHQAWLKIENGQQILHESQFLDPNLVESQQPSVLQDQNELTNPQSDLSRSQETPRRIENQFHQQQAQQLSEFQSAQQIHQGYRSVPQTPRDLCDQEPRRISQTEKKTPPPQQQQNEEEIIQIQPSQSYQPRRSEYYGRTMMQSANQSGQMSQFSDWESLSSSDNDGIFGGLIRRFKNFFQ